MEKVCQYCGENMYTARETEMYPDIQAVVYRFPFCLRYDNDKEHTTYKKHENTSEVTE